MFLSSGLLRDLTGRVGLPFPYVPMAPPTPVDSDGGIYWINFGHTVSALAIVPALLCMVRYKDWIANRALSWKPVRFLGRMSYTLYVWHTLVFFLVLDVLGGDRVLGEKWRIPILAALTIVACLPIFYGVEQRMLRVKLRFASEKEVLDLNTGKMVSVEEATAGSRKGGST
jgi:peptidoglycan/LPS O-acetylase OafA/YrhL